MGMTVELIIDGVKVQVPEGVNIIDASERAGIHIPNLCYLKGMKGIGACRLCLVEVEGLKAPVIACNTKVKEGMVVRTKTDNIQEVRKFVIDLLLSMHPLDCMTCTKAGACNLQQYAYEFGLKESSFRRKRFGHPTDEANPFIKRDPEYCILCGRCVRICREQGTHVLEFMGRGIESKVITAGDRPLQESACTFCGSCLDVCPVNALLESDSRRMGREWEYEKTDSVCLLCGNSCSIVVSTKDGRIQKIHAGGDRGSADSYICAVGRFGFECIEAGTRIAAPMKRVNGELMETTWEDALKTVALRLKSAGERAGFISSAGITNEDAIILKKLARDVVKTPHVDTSVSLYADNDYLILSQTADFNRADVIVLVGLDPSQWKRILPALDASVRRMVGRGAKLIVINESECRIGEVAAFNLRGNVISILKRIVKSMMEKGIKVEKKLRALVQSVEVTEEIEKAARLIAGANEPVIFSSAAFFEASANIALLKGRIIAVPLESNAKGVTLMGLMSDGKSCAEMLNNETEILYVVGNVPFRKKPDTAFLVVQNAHLTPLAEQADIVFPSATFFETSGTVIDYMGRLRHLRKVVHPCGKSMSHRDIFISVAKTTGSVLQRPTIGDVRKKSGMKMKIRVGPFEKKERFDVSPGEFIEAITASVVHGSRLQWLTEIEKAMGA